MSRSGTASLASPVRVLGAVRIIAGGWLVAKGVATLTQYRDLLPMAQRIFNGDPGTTDAPMRSLLSLATAPILILIGVVLAVKGFRWMRRIRPPAPAALDRDEVTGTLVRRDAPAFGAGPSLPYWPLRRWLSEPLNDLPWWRRDIMGRGVRAFVRSCGFVVALAILHVALRSLRTDDLLGPFPAVFVVLLLTATAAWAVLSLILLATDGRRIESFEFRLPDRAAGAKPLGPGTIIESPPRLVVPESPAPGLALGIVGVGVQCLIGSQWQLSSIGYPLMATSIIRHIGSLAGGIVFLMLGGRMVTAAAELLYRFRYASTMVYIDGDSEGRPVGRGATLRTESHGPDGPRHIVVAVASSDARDDVQTLLTS